VFRRYGWQAALIFAVGLVILITGLGANPSGLGALGESFSMWLSGTGAQQQTVPAAGLLVLYEPLITVGAIVGLVYLRRRQRALGALLGFWAVAALLLLGVLPGRGPLDTLAVVLPGALLGGAGIGHVAGELRQKGVWRSIRVYIPVVVMLWIYMALMLGRYGAQAEEADLLLAMLAFLMQALLLALFALVTSGEAALHALAVGGGLLLVAYTLSAGWGVTHVRPADPSEPLLDQPTAEETHLLVETLRELSWDETGMPATLAFAHDIRSDPVLAWYLRDFEQAQTVDLTVGDEVLLPVLVTLGRDLDPSHNQFVGQDFALRRNWTPAELNCTWTWPLQCSAGIRWWLLRQTPAVPAISEWATIWAKTEDETSVEQ
jgi:hypothetical protein